MYHNVRDITIDELTDIIEEKSYGIVCNVTQIRFWDWRNRKQVACLEESHVEDVTQVLPDACAMCLVYGDYHWRLTMIYV